jgi:hypothetical protein
MVVEGSRMTRYWDWAGMFFIVMAVLGMLIGSSCQIHQPKPATSVAPLNGPRYVVVKFLGEEVANCWVVDGSVKFEGTNKVILTYKDGRVVTSIGSELSSAYLPKPTEVLLERTFEGLGHYRLGFFKIKRCMR